MVGNPRMCFKNLINDKDAYFDVTVTSVDTFKHMFQAYGRGENVEKIARKGYNTMITWFTRWYKFFLIE